MSMLKSNCHRRYHHYFDHHHNHQDQHHHHHHHQEVQRWDTCDPSSWTSLSSLRRGWTIIIKMNIWWKSTYHDNNNNEETDHDHDVDEENKTWWQKLWRVWGNLIIWWFAADFFLQLISFFQLIFFAADFFCSRFFLLLFQLIEICFLIISPFLAWQQ